jgi:hypothetical protein
MYDFNKSTIVNNPQQQDPTWLAGEEHEKTDFIVLGTNLIMEQQYFVTMSAIGTSSYLMALKYFVIYDT